MMMYIPEWPQSLALIWLSQPIRGQLKTIAGLWGPRICVSQTLICTLITLGDFYETWPKFHHSWTLHQGMPLHIFWGNQFQNQIFRPFLFQFRWQPIEKYRRNNFSHNFWVSSTKHFDFRGFKGVLISESFSLWLKFSSKNGVKSLPWAS